MIAPPLDMATTLAVLCEDALFAVTGAGKLDFEALRALAGRRSAALAATAKGLPGPRMKDWDAWIHGLVAALAPIAPPRWVPMAEVIQGGLSLEHGARGVRSFFTSKPSDKEVTRVRTLGATAARTLGAVLSATGSFNAEAKLLRGAFVASLGLPDEDRQKLDDEPPRAVDALDLHASIEPKIARAMVRGCYTAAMNDGMDPREEQAILAIGRKLGLGTEDMNEAFQGARDHIESTKDFGEATSDAIRYVLDGVEERDLLAAAAVRLTLPAVLRRDALTAINVGGPVTLGRKHPLERRQREAVLGITWLAAVHGNPSYTKRALLAARHDRVAADLAEGVDGPSVRGSIDHHVEIELCAAAEAASK
jgi:hypothetical protein